MKLVIPRKVMLTIVLGIILFTLHGSIRLRQLLGHQEELDYELENRQQRVQKICETNKQTLEWKEAEFRRSIKRHLWDFSSRLVYCPMSEVATEDFFMNFLEIMKINTEGYKELQKSRGLNEENNEVNSSKKGFRTIMKNITSPDTWNFRELIKVCHSLSVLKTIHVLL